MTDAYSPFPAAPGASVRIAEAVHLCRLQSTTRQLCRTAGFDESAVHQAVIAATEFAHRAFVEPSLDGDLEMSVIRRRAGCWMELRARGGSTETGPAYLIVSFAARR